MTRLELKVRCYKLMSNAKDYTHEQRLVSAKYFMKACDYLYPLCGDVHKDNETLNAHLKFIRSIKRAISN